MARASALRKQTFSTFFSRLSRKSIGLDSNSWLHVGSRPEHLQSEVIVQIDRFRNASMPRGEARCPRNRLLGSAELVPSRALCLRHVSAAFMVPASYLPVSFLFIYILHEQFDH